VEHITKIRLPGSSLSVVLEPEAPPPDTIFEIPLVNPLVIPLLGDGVTDGVESPRVGMLHVSK
jgi:hypothetical protein